MPRVTKPQQPTKIVTSSERWMRLDVLDTAAQPQYVEKDLNAVADQIIARHGGRVVINQQGACMPVTRVAIRKGKPAGYKEAILNSIYSAQLETVHISEGDRFMALSEHEASEFAYGANFLGIKRTDDLVQIQVFWAPGKGVDLKKAMYKKIVEYLGRNPGVRAEDILISVFESSAENWSFGNGETQFYKS